MRSLLAQTLVGVEVVVLDLGTDDTAARVRSAFGDRVSIVSAPGGTVPRARNAALVQSGAPYVALASSDTPAAPERLARQVAALDAHRDAGLCHTDACFVDEDGAPAELPPERRPRPRAPREGGKGEMARALLLQGNPILGATVMLRRSVLDAVGLFDEAPGLGWDFDLWVRVASVSGVLHVAEPLTAYRARTFAIPDDGPSQASLRHLAALAKHESTARELGVPLQKRRQEVLLELAYEAVVEGNAPLARRAIREAASLGPLRPHALPLAALTCAPAATWPLLRALRRGVSGTRY